jgi:5-methylcytosine-specific restriction endonuclease McrA
MDNLETLSTDDLLARPATLVAVDHQTTADIVACLVEIEERRLHLALGYSSLSAFCVERFGFSEDVAFKRIRVARAAREFPEILELLREGAISLSGVATLAPHLADHPELLDQALGRSSRQIEHLVASRVPDDRSPRGDQRIRPVGDGLYKLEVVLTQDQMQKLEKARDLARHRNPSGELSVLIERGLDLLIEGMEKQRFAITDQPRTRRAASTDTGRATAEVRRQVYRRDGGQCTFVGADGRRCAETGFIEIDHAREKALGGGETAGNLRIRCRGHNRYTAEQTFGKQHMDAARARAEAQRQVAAHRRAVLADTELGLTSLGFSRGEAKTAVDHVAETVDESTPLEDCLRAALRFLTPSARR